MSDSRAELDARRDRLAARAGVEREEIGGQLERWQGVTAGADRALAWLGAAKRHVPMFGVTMGLGVTALLLARPRMIAGAFRGGLALWRLGQSVRTLFGRTRR